MVRSLTFGKRRGRARCTFKSRPSIRFPLVLLLGLHRDDFSRDEPSFSFERKDALR